MAITEKKIQLRRKDSAGNAYSLMPKTKAECVDGLDELIEEAKVLDISVAATSTDGIAYTATVPGITALTAGFSFIMIPDKISASRTPTLNVNGLGAKSLRVRVSGYSATTSAAMTTNWIASNKPLRVTYDGLWWVAEIILPSAQQLYGNVKAEDVDYTNTSSGLSATKVQAAIDELATGALRTQVLTTEEYNAVENKDENVLYMLSDDTTEDDIQEHMKDTAKHITAAERTAWNAKAEKTYVDSSIQSAIQSSWEASY